MRTECDNFLFFSDFDSGNLERLEFVGESVITSIPSQSSSFSSKSGLSSVNQTSSVHRSRPKRYNGLSTADLCKHPQDKNIHRDGNLQKLGTQPSSILDLSSNKNSPPNISCKEFKLWTRPDCSDTAFENSNRSWFYFGVESAEDAILRLHVMNMNRQNKLMSQGMTPVVKVIPNGPQLMQAESEGWKRVASKPTYQEEGNNFVLTFDQAVTKGTTTFLAFCYPFSYRCLQAQLECLDRQHPDCLNWTPNDDGSPEDVYYCRELICQSVGGLRLDVLTVTSRKGLMDVREDPLLNLFPNSTVPRCHTFSGKKVVFISARVHPGETQSSFVLNGFLKFILSENDSRAVALRDLYVFKLIPMLNPDGVLRGHYRTDLAGVNLNRTYLLADFKLHPTIFAARSLLLLYHQLYAKRSSDKQINVGERVNLINTFLSDRAQYSPIVPRCQLLNNRNGFSPRGGLFKPSFTEKLPVNLPSSADSGLAFYIDLHGHASKRGCFLYGNHFTKTQDKIESLLLAKLMSINFAHFDYAACNFSEQNMYQRDTRDGLSKEGSGRVALHALTGFLHSYTLECNFNTGRTVNVVACLPGEQEKVAKYSPSKGPPKYTPQIFQEAGEALAVSMLDMAGSNPMGRLPLTAHGSLSGLRTWLSQQVAGEKSPVLCAGRRKQRSKDWGIVATSVTLSVHSIQHARTSITPNLKGNPLIATCGSAISCVNRSFRIPIWMPCRNLQYQTNIESKLQTERPVKPGMWSHMRGSMSNWTKSLTPESHFTSRLQGPKVNLAFRPGHDISVVGQRLHK